MDIAVVGAGVSLTLDNSGTCTAARVALGAVAPTVLLVDDCAKALIGTKVDDAALARLGEAASAACRPISDKRGTKEYRIKVSGVIAKRAAQIALQPFEMLAPQVSQTIFRHADAFGVRKILPLQHQSEDVAGQLRVQIFC